MGRLAELFRPESVAVIGATDREGAVGRAILENLQADYTGEIVPVNPKRDEVLGLECYPGVESAPSVDLAVVVVPPPIVLESVRELGKAGTKNVVVVTAGFSETGGEGAERERELREIADEYDLNVVGPNSLGIMSTAVGMNATFGPENAREGSISFMSQSGAFITAVLDWANEQKIGFRDVVSVGNKSVLDETDFVDEWGDDPDTDVVIGYLEDIDDGQAFIETAREVTDETPIVLVKSGRTDAGAQAASSHTGAIAGSERAYEAGLEQAGVIRAESVQELFDSARALSGLPDPKSDGVAIVTNAGGPGVLTTDAVGDSTLEMADFTDVTIDRLTEAMPDEANVYNPIDAIGDADVDRFAEALEIALDDPNVGSAVVVSAPTAVLPYDELSEVVIEKRDTYDKPVVTCLMGGERARAAEDVLRDVGIPNYFDPSRAVQGLDALARYRDVRQRATDDPTAFDVDRERAREILERTKDRDDNRLGVESMDLLEAYGIPIPEGEIVDDPDRAREVAQSIEGDVVMKIVSPDISHKSDIGGVKVGVADDDVYDAYEEIVTRARNYQPDATIVGIQVQEMVDLESSTETIVGMNRDPQFGPLLLFGLGGIFVEILEDTSVRVAPIGEGDAREMIDEIQAAPLLRGARGREPADVDEVVETIQRLSQLVTDFPSILELDVNPLVAGPDGVQAIDLRLTVDTEKL
ncbi:acetate--CoA ligase alpha subunit [Natronobacterium gregoryi]|uniref:acetate--CoA ligase (ADP-forming) n=2 Tax=Natronobacterium gregoryi TaxID=44930 RepID=L0AMR3_NATGS|nr:acetate--CoA ligase [Natronobacterium gregoryi]AFZ74360.1 ADP-forming acetyl coenzyme A synthetase [Natronobacterium gregoryi SP2]ELY63326.1 CoA-binding domain-containing protein [Natronobacterium gregoryi SP2]PLK22131.1 acetyl-CoA synthetase [Natronobacterium gregoryi SP2]SFI54436.1 acetyltransferase [Natronobacterium gregoryi]